MVRVAFYFLIIFFLHMGITSHHNQLSMHIHLLYLYNSYYITTSISNIISNASLMHTLIYLHYAYGTIRGRNFFFSIGFYISYPHQLELCIGIVKSLSMHATYAKETCAKFFSSQKVLAFFRLYNL